MIEPFDPLETKSNIDEGIIIAAQKREISNILRSYTGYYDVFCETIQNALDAAERHIHAIPTHQGRVQISINMKTLEICVTDNGTGMNQDQFRQFLRPNFSFKDGSNTRGCKGVGATYLAYGFNHIEIATKQAHVVTAGVMLHGRDWVEDRSGTIIRPKIQPTTSYPDAIDAIDSGTAVTIKLTGDNIRPRSLGWIGAHTAEQWLAVLKVNTPVGGIYLCKATSPNIIVAVEVVDEQGNKTDTSSDFPQYLYPHAKTTRVADLSVYLADQQRRVKRNEDITRIPPKFQKLFGLWGEWTGKQIIKDEESDCPINIRLEESEKESVRKIGIHLYAFLAYSTDFWDDLNDNKLRLRRSARMLRGGLQLATKNMPQGMIMTIPMTNNIGFQNLAHVIIHFENAEPDLGRKGFQPEHVRLAEKLSVAAVTAFRRHYVLLRKPGVAKIFGDEVKLSEWIRAQEEHEKTDGLVITGDGLFLPQQELPIRSTPLVEQDVVALFNQMLSSGIVRGVQLISSSQYKQYDGLYRIRMARPFEDFIISGKNPLGIDEETFSGAEEVRTAVKILEYKYSMDGLIEELQSEVKSTEDIGLVVCWEMGQKWRTMFDGVSYLDPDHIHLRQVHGTTHAFTHSVSGARAFEAVILSDLVSYLRDRDTEGVRQQGLMGQDEL